MSIGPDQNLEQLRLDHRSERIPAGLRQRVLERLERSRAAATSSDAASSIPGVGHARRVWARSSLALGMTGAVLGAVWWLLPASEHIAAGRVGPEPSLAQSPGVTSADPVRAPLTSSPALARPCPLDELAGGPSRDTFTGTPPPPPGAEHVGMSWHTLRLPTRNCGLLPRHFLQLVPPGTAPVYRGRVLILLPGMGSPESLAVETRWYFEGLAREKQAIVVYAKALQEPRPSRPGGVVGGWQSDAGAHPEVDDEEYLDRIVLDLSRRGIIGGGNEVWLVGKGSGAVMALSAAAHHPERYSGVAAFSPQRLDVLPPEGLAGPRLGRRLARALFVIDGRAEDVFGGQLVARSKEWALALGAPMSSGRSPRIALSPRLPGLRQIDIGSGESGAPGVRVLTVEPGVDPFPPPGAADALSLAASRRRLNAINGAEEVWTFLGGE